jgi:thiosulfate/3-mercaptopyruvate sulfurtransferase
LTTDKTPSHALVDRRQEVFMFRCALILAAAVISATSTLAQGASAARGGLLTSPAELAAALKNDSALVVLHVADRAAAFEDAHIPGARFVRYVDIAIEGGEGVGSELPLVDQVKRVLQAVGVSNASRVVVYGASTVGAARLFFTLDAMGHPRVSLLDGGLRAWRAEGNAIDTGPATPGKPGTFTPVLNAARVASAQSIQQQLPAGAIALVDVRPDPEFLGTDGGMNGAHAPGHIEGAKQLPWNTLVGPDGRFLPRDQLQARLGSAGAVPGKPVVAYCMVGMRAAVVYFVARHLGYDARLYDGSIVDWTMRKLPLKTGR